MAVFSPYVPYAKVHFTFPFCFVMPFMIMAVFYEKK